MADSLFAPALSGLQPILPSGATLLDIAWAAGLFEGEGCFSHNKIAPSCVLASVDEDVIRRFAAIVGIGSLRLDARSARGKRGQDIWYWATAGYPSVQYVTALFWPWLHSRRRARISDLLREYALRPAQNQRRDTCSRGHDQTNPANVYTHKKPGGRTWRHCKVCASENARKHYEAHRDARRKCLPA
jgi:hypothetical protein